MSFPPGVLIWLRRFFAAFIVFICHQALAADDLKTTSGRIYKDATVIRVDAHALVVQHRFGVVRVPFSEIKAESREKFNPQRAREMVRQRHAQEKASAEKAQSSSEPVHQERAALQRATVELEEQDQLDAEQLEEKIRQKRTEPRDEHASMQRFRLRGEVIGVIPPDVALVLCEPTDGASASYVRRELAHLPDSPFAPPRPADTEVIAVTGVRKVSEGQSVDISVSPSGMKRDFRTRSGENYSGRYRVFRALD